MTTKDPPPKADGLLAFLTTVLKKSADLPKDVSALTAVVEILAEQLMSVSQSVDSLIVAMQNQNKAITDLYTVQEYMLKMMKPDAGVDSSLPVINKQKPDKPN